MWNSLKACHDMTMVVVHAVETPTFNFGRSSSVYEMNLTSESHSLCLALQATYECGNLTHQGSFVT